MERCQDLGLWGLDEAMGIVNDITAVFFSLLLDSLFFSLADMHF